VSKEILGFALSHVTDPVTAAKLADQLGKDAAEFTPVVVYPSAWVLAKQKAAVKLAAHAVTYCDDPATLEHIATTTTRQGVMKALVANPATSDAARSRILRDPLMTTTRPTPTPTTLSPAALAELEELVRIHSGPSSAGTSSWVAAKHLNFLNNLLDRASTPPDIVDALVDKLIALDPKLVPVSFFSAFTGTKTAQGYAHFWTRGSLTPQDLAARLSTQENTAALTDLLKFAITARQENTAKEELDLDVLDLIIKYVAPASIPTYKATRYSVPTHIFSDASVELLLGSPQWMHLLWYHTLTTSQLAKLITRSTASQVLDLVDCFSGNYELITLLLDQLPARAEVSNRKTLQSILAVAKGPHDPLLHKLVEHAVPEMLVEYITGNWATGPYRFQVPLMPTIEDLALLAPRVSLAPPAVLQSAIAQMVHQRYERAPESYYQALLDLIPGAIPAMLDDPRHAPYIFRRLTGTGAPMDIILDQLNNASNTGLNNFVEVLTALSRVSTKN
jgi:hypothetical protein